MSECCNRFDLNVRSAVIEIQRILRQLERTPDRPSLHRDLKGARDYLANQKANRDAHARECKALAS